MVIGFIRQLVQNVLLLQFQTLFEEIAGQFLSLLIHSQQCHRREKTVTVVLSGYLPHVIYSYCKFCFFCLLMYHFFPDINIFKIIYFKSIRRKVLCGSYKSFPYFNKLHMV